LERELEREREKSHKPRKNITVVNVEESLLKSHQDHVQNIESVEGTGSDGDSIPCHRIMLRV